MVNVKLLKFDLTFLNSQPQFKVEFVCIIKQASELNLNSLQILQLICILILKLSTIYS